VNANQLFRWRKPCQEGLLGTTTNFLPVRVANEQFEEAVNGSAAFNRTQQFYETLFSLPDLTGNHVVSIGSPLRKNFGLRRTTRHYLRTEFEIRIDDLKQMCRVQPTWHGNAIAHLPHRV
jgi:hypothetical protein